MPLLLPQSGDDGWPRRGTGAVHPPSVGGSRGGRAQRGLQVGMNTPGGDRDSRQQWRFPVLRMQEEQPAPRILMQGVICQFSQKRWHRRGRVDPTDVGQERGAHAFHSCPGSLSGSATALARCGLPMRSLLWSVVSSLHRWWMARRACKHRAGPIMTSVRYPLPLLPLSAPPFKASVRRTRTREKWTRAFWYEDRTDTATRARDEDPRDDADRDRNVSVLDVSTPGVSEAQNQHAMF